DSAKEPQGRVVVDDQDRRARALVADCGHAALFYPLRPFDPSEMVSPTDGLPQPTPIFRRRAWLRYQRALDPLAPPRPLPARRARDSSRARSSTLSHTPGH